MTHQPNGRQESSHFWLPPAKGMEQDAGKQTTKSVRHYRLTSDEWLQACDELKPAEIKVLYYLRTLDPWGDKGMEIGVTELAKILKCNKGTVSRALKKLDSAGWIDLEISTATVKLHTQSSTSELKFPAENPLSVDNTVVSGSKALSTDNLEDRQTTQLIARQHLASETQTAQGSQIALNSLNLNKLTTHIKTECGVVSVSTNQEANPDVSSPNRPVPLLKKSSPVHKPIPVEKELIIPPILQSAKKLGVNITDRPLLEMVKQWPERLDDAIAALEEKASRVQSPTRFLVRAIKDGWQPEAPRTNKAPEGFGAWFGEGRARCLMVASQRVDGILKVLMACDEWVPYNLLQTLSWDEIAARFGKPRQECYASYQS